MAEPLKCPAIEPAASLHGKVEAVIGQHREQAAGPARLHRDAGNFTKNAEPVDDPGRQHRAFLERNDLVRTAARAAGMRRMQEDALEKLQAGVTTLEEILRVVPMEALATSGCERCGNELPPAYRFCPYCGTGRGPGVSDSPAGSSLSVAEGILS